MNNLMRKYFYDKSVEFYKYEKIGSSEGGRSKKGEKVAVGSIQCNIQPTSHKQIKETYGIDIDAKYVVTCGVSEHVENGWQFYFKGEEMEIVELLYYDSHLMILCQ
ncbi:hypothetical protein PT155_08690 [Erysipelothrix rhusiopathiae]|nr:hypothetical protein [Erysipelothrix rhusiopathiae]MDE8060609.1 hypothetical protein [Erysipelothrix rhusiopathiae]MDE8079188.1 hypothetical protein [Erysipelothrix rhusiopathiae]MDE8084281.1 hypothetical protein [Erysipelothrix rhusiopathiae]MDE8094543.1 hypothetical protein [Erysipelothrix rhusiopathiae]